MINTDISNVWGEVSLPDLLALEKEISDAHDRLAQEEKDILLKAPDSDSELRKIQETAEQIRSDSDICIILGEGGCVLGAQAAIDLLQGPERNLGKEKEDPQVFFAGNSLSSRQWNRLLKILEEKDYTVIVTAREELSLETAIAFRALRWMLERKYGTDKANGRIYAVTDPEQGTLRQMAMEAGWTAFPFPQNLGESYGVLTAAGLLPMAVAGIDIEALAQGAREAMEEYSLRSYENPVWLYAAMRNLLLRGGKAVELLESYEPGFRKFGTWWQQLFAQSEGKTSQALFPAPAELPEDLHSLGQLIQQGPRNLFETVLLFEASSQPVSIGSDWKNLDGLNYLEKMTLDQVQEQFFQGTISAHVDGGVPVVVLECGALCPRTLGQLFYFMELSCAISAYALGVDPFPHPGMNDYQEAVFSLLGKPEQENP